jgi:putative transposase
MDDRKEFPPELLEQLLKGVSTQADLFGPDGVLKRLTGALVERALKAELDHHLRHATPPADAQAPRNRANGTTPKRLQTEHGAVPLAVPRDRDGTFEPALLPKRSSRVAGLDDKILALYARGLSTREIEQHLSELYGTTISASLISEVTEAVRDEIVAWQGRPLERRYAVVWLDALVLKVRDGGVVNNKAVYLAIGLRLDGSKELLGLWLEANEGAKFWQRVLAELRTRGVEDVLIVCCDGLKGFAQAIEAVFPQTVVQTCVVHQLRYSLSFVSWQDRTAVVRDLRAIYQADSEATALAALDAFEATWRKKYPTVGASWRRNWETLRPFLELQP